jgi:hypothetical protein
MIFNLRKFILERNKVQFILFMTLYSWVLTILALPITIYLDSFKPHESFADKYSPLGFFMLGVVFAPLIETIIFQLGVIETFRKIFRNNQYLLIALSALCLVRVI